VITKPNRMKPTLYALLSISICLIFLIGISCQKEISPTTDIISKGTLKSTVTRDCNPSVVNGIYKVDSALNNTNYIDIQINVTTPGSYSIQSNKVNGYSFSGTGVINTGGLNTVRLQGSGKPIAAGVNSFSIAYDSSVCTVVVTTIAAGSNRAFYTLADASGNCIGASIKGVYKAGVPLDSSNYLELSANVTTPGAYSITTTSVNGISFTGSGTFTTSGAQTIILRATGTPIAPGNFNVSISNGTAGCTYALTVLPAASTAAVYTLNCTPVVLGGVYTAGTTMTSSNTAKISATVSTPGTYTITTTTVNGVTFSATNTFANASTTPQQIILTASGTANAAGTFAFPVSGSGSTCTFSVPFTPAASPAVFTLAGAPNACTAAVINGSYISGTALTSSNTVTVKVDVTSAGPYTLSTNTVNGIKFSGSGVFATTGVGQNVTLIGSGTPVAAGSSTFVPTIGTSLCTFNIPVTAPSASSGTYQCKIDGVLTTFNELAEAKLVDPFGQKELFLNGDVAPGNGSWVPYCKIFIINNDGSAVKSGTYNVNGFLGTNGYTLEVDYLEDPTGTAITWNTSSNSLTTPPPFTVTVTSISTTRVKGTFSGKLTDIMQGSSRTKTITEGVFDLPIN
jgi:hypothetical protein